MKGYRFVTKHMKSEHGNVTWKIGEWQHCDGNLVLCENGFHASQEPLDSLDYQAGDRWFQCETKGEVLRDVDKFCARSMRLTKEIPISVLQQFAIACAFKVLPMFENQYPDDNRPRKAIEASQTYLQSPTKSNAKKRAAARAAAWNAVRDAWNVAASPTWNAARAAARAAAWVATSVADAAWHTAGATRAAARAVAWDAEAPAWAWQNKHLKKLIKEVKA
jgi:hypothetical protein